MFLARKTRKFPRGAVSHSYYAMFHVMSAALLSRDSIAHTHAGIIHKFSNSFIKSKDIPRQWGKIIKELFMWRQDADYEALKEITSGQASVAINQATAFLKVVKKLLKEEV